MPEMTTLDSIQYQKIAQVIRRMQAATAPLGLAQLAAEASMSEFRLQKLFSRWVGISPKRFGQYLSKQYALAALRQNQSVLDVALDTGLSGPGRLHDLLISCEAMSPGEIKRQGTGLKIGYGLIDTPFGLASMGWTQRGICHFAFDDPQPDQTLKTAWPNAVLEPDAAQAQTYARQIFPTTPTSGRLHLVLRGTNFQIKVWEALLGLPCNSVYSYRQLAEASGYPGAARAVGNALAQNPVGYLIPCHRVIRESGEPGAYRWGAERKVMIQAWEAARSCQVKPTINTPAFRHDRMR